MTPITESFEERWERLRQRTSVAGWKGTRSVAVAGATWDWAKEFVRVVREETGCSLRPFVSANEAGSVCLSWGTAPGPVVDVEIKSSGSFEWEFESAGDYKSGEENRGAILQHIRESLCAA